MPTTTLAFLSMLDHRCDIQKAAITVASTGTYGHDNVNLGSPTTVKSGIACRFSPLSTQEMVRMGLEATINGTFALYLRPDDMPSELTMFANTETFQVANVLRRDGRTISAGPFNITSVLEPVAEDHHFKLLLQRTS